MHDLTGRTLTRRFVSGRSHQITECGRIRGVFVTDGGITYLVETDTAHPFHPLSNLAALVVWHDDDKITYSLEEG